MKKNNNRAVSRFFRWIPAFVRMTGTFYFVSCLFVSPVFATDTIKFATEATYPPYVYMGPSGQVEGFGADIVKAVCKQMQAVCTISNQPWDSLIPSLKLGKFDALFGGMNITTARQKEVDFTDPYYTNSVSFIADKNKPLTLSKQGLKGKIIGVQGGTTFDSYLQDSFGNSITIQRYPSEEDALMDLTSGRVDGVVGDTPLIKQWLKQNGRREYVLIGKPVNDPNYFGKGVGIAVKKGNQALLLKLNKALAAIKANGVYAAIVQKYFGQE
ncbi:arginine ABC transporter substrate-binding protein [Coxiella burnetii]|uniref:arginine ABC transporter substrate-binding protein n=1 Tax=Coxiella burnetii TaxID=777 RepID=UPI000183CE01|nr:arginine ABC transporter substrate-binding protein [Coxiella burnetii]ACJ18825.1 arginine-binding protein [Coxiella burnetii CbuG_Q212]ATN67196.1 arginine ABC transporter substrate-binding protein [Coxiella burnetii]OYK85795.1 arginine ABC transporter substrate-binding protein [Coxiella burnetii]